MKELLDRLRNQGLRVAVHNDYTLHGKLFTFWLMTYQEEDGTTIAFKGEGETDQAALYEIDERFRNHMDERHGAAPVLDSESWPGR